MNPFQSAPGQQTLVGGSGSTATACPKADPAATTTIESVTKPTLQRTTKSRRQNETFPLLEEFLHHKRTEMHAAALKYLRTSPLCNRANAEDAVCEAISIAFRRRERFDLARVPKYATHRERMVIFEGWFRTILKNACCDMKEKDARHPTVPLEQREGGYCERKEIYESSLGRLDSTYLEDHRDEIVSAETLCMEKHDADEIKREIAAVLASLTLPQREMLTEAYLKDRDRQDVAEDFKTDAHRLRNALWEIRRRVRAICSETGLLSPALIGERIPERAHAATTNRPANRVIASVSEGCAA